MIAVVDDGKFLHIVKWTGRVRLHAEAHVYCGKEFDAGNGVLQVPDAVFTQAASFNVAPAGKPVENRKACPGCRTHAQATLS